MSWKVCYMYLLENLQALAWAILNNSFCGCHTHTKKIVFRWSVSRWHQHRKPTGHWREACCYFCKLNEKPVVWEGEIVIPIQTQGENAWSKWFCDLLKRQGNFLSCGLSCSYYSACTSWLLKKYFIWMKLLVDFSHLHCIVIQYDCKSISG